jgi:two-component system response regulator AtoC
MSGPNLSEARTPISVLIVENHDETAPVLQPALETRGYRVSTVRCGDAAIARMGERFFDIVLLCACAPGDLGLRTLVRAREIQSDAQFIVLAHDDSVGTAVRAMSLGAFDYLVAPVNPDEAQVRIRRALEQTQTQREIARLRRAASRSALGGLVGRSPGMRHVFDLIQRVAPLSISALVIGETGTGKELVARAIHDLSPRKRAAFVPVSCAAVPETLLESELFGHTRGSFTGAVTDRRGLFEEARGGTVFLDEVDSIACAMQAKLLRVVEERTIQRVGASHDIPVDFRLVAASNRDLAELVETGHFRADLYFRLNVFPIEIPPLRDRTEDIPLLAAHFRDEMARTTDLPVMPFPLRTIRRMESYAWPGNVRELRHYVERLMVVSAGKRSMATLPLPPGNGHSTDGLRHALDERWNLSQLESEYIRVVLEHTRGNRNRAASLLGIDRRTLYRKIDALQGCP